MNSEFSTERQIAIFCAVLWQTLCNGAADYQHDDRANQPSPRFASLSIESLLESCEMPKRSFGYKQCTFE